MKQESESYYALTISIYASKEIQEQAKHGERWIGPDGIIGESGPCSQRQALDCTEILRSNSNCYGKPASI